MGLQPAPQLAHLLVCCSTFQRLNSQGGATTYPGLAFGVSDEQVCPRIAFTKTQSSNLIHRVVLDEWTVADNDLVVSCPEM